MGWSSGWVSRAAMLAHLRDKSRFSEGVKIIKSQVIGNNLWYVAFIPTENKEVICLDIISGDFGTKKNPEWGYKGLQESFGPNEVNCPLGYLKHGADTVSGYAVEWREKVKTFHANKAAKQGLKQGSVVIFQGIDYELVRKNGGRGWLVKRLSDSQQFCMSNMQLNKAEIKALV